MGYSACMGQGQSKQVEAVKKFVSGYDVFLSPSTGGFCFVRPYIGMVSIENVAQALLALTTHEHGFNRNQYVNCLATLS